MREKRLSENTEWSGQSESRVCEEPRKETDYVKDRPSATSEMIPRPRPGDTFNDPPDPGSWARAERRQCQGATTMQLLPLQYGEIWPGTSSAFKSLSSASK